MLTKKELKEIRESMGKLLAAVREPKYKKNKFPFPTKYPLMKASEIVSLTQDIVDILIDLKKNEPDNGELWLVKIAGNISVGEIVDQHIYMPGEEDGRPFDEVQKFIRRIDTSEE